MARYPGYQVEPSEPAPTKPISLGLANFQQAKLEKEANLPLSPSLEAWLTCQAQTLEGKDRHGRVIKPPFYLPRRRRPGTGDIATPPVCLSVCLSVRHI